MAAMQEAGFTDDTPVYMASGLLTYGDTTGVLRIPIELVPSHHGVFLGFLTSRHLSPQHTTDEDSVLWPRPLAARSSVELKLGTREHCWMANLRMSTDV